MLTPKQIASQLQGHCWQQCQSLLLQTGSPAAPAVCCTASATAEISTSSAGCLKTAADSHGKMEDLPPPQSRLQTEIVFRRQLRACEDIMRGRNQSRPEFAAWQSSPVFHKVACRNCAGHHSQQEMTVHACAAQYVESLQDNLSDLETEGAKRCSLELLLLQLLPQLLWLRCQVMPAGSRQTC